MSGIGVVIGVDPGLKTGVAFWDIGRQQFTMITSGAWWDIYDLLRSQDPCRASMVIEDSSANNFIYSRHGRDVTRRISRNVGMNQAYARLLIDGLRRIGFVVQTIVPHRHRRKLDATTFSRIVQWHGSTDQHGRDAAMLVFGVKETSMG